MKEVLNKQSLRQLALLELLWNKEWVTVSEIVKEIGGVEKTIRTDIKQLNEIIEPLTIETSFKHGVFLNKEMCISKTHLYALFLQKSVECQLLEMILFNPHITKGEVCDRLYISETQLNRLQVKLNKGFEKYGIKITTDLTIVGDERNIRKLLSSLFYEKYLSPDHFFKEKEFQLIDQVIRKFYKANTAIIAANNQYHFLLNKMRMKILVAIYRCKSDYFLEQKQHFFDYTMITEDKELNKRWQVVFGISLTEKILHNIFEHYYAPFKVTETCLELGASQFALKTRLEQLIGMICQQLKIECRNQDALIHAILWSSFLTVGPSYILHNTKEEFVLELLRDKQAIASDLQKYFADIYSDLSLSAEDKNNILYQSIYTLVTQWHEFRVEIRKTIMKIKAALLLDAPEEHMIMLKEEIEYHFRNMYKVDILLPDDPITFSRLNCYDCTLTNLLNIDELGEVSVIGIPNYFGEEFIKKLHLFFNSKKMSEGFKATLLT